MFFRRRRPADPTFEERLDSLRQLGFAIERQADGAIRASRDGCAAVVKNQPGAPPAIERAGLLIGGEIGALVDGGFQKFWRAASGVRQPALARQLRALHNFEEDLREALGLVSRYNTSLGTTNTFHHYDRLCGRDMGAPQRPWDR